MAKSGRKAAVVTAATSLTGVALVMGIPGTGGAAPATRAPGVDPDGYTLACSQVTAKVVFSPHLKIEAGSGSVTEKYKVELDDCTAESPTGGAPILVSSGTMAGSIVVADNGCAGLLGTSDAQGTLTAKFKVPAGAPKLTDKDATLTAKIEMGAADPASDGYQLQLEVSQTGAFSGGDAGANDVVQFASTSYDPGESSSNSCSSASGLKDIAFGDGSVQLG